MIEVAVLSVINDGCGKTLVSSRADCETHICHTIHVLGRLTHGLAACHSLI